MQWCSSITRRPSKRPVPESPPNGTAVGQILEFHKHKVLENKLSRCPCGWQAFQEFQLGLEDGHMDIQRSWAWKDEKVFSKGLIFGSTLSAY